MLFVKARPESTENLLDLMIPLESVNCEAYNYALSPLTSSLQAQNSLDYFVLKHTLTLSKDKKLSQSQMRQEENI
jgi:hypothetical protein